jgi:polar amino acid transport system substrate-binding protein
MTTRVQWTGWLLGLLAATAADAGCSRAIEVPMAPVGLSVRFDGERAAGIYPTLLREVGAAAGCEFQFQRVPRARLQKMFESGQADLLIPASASPTRERDGEFVPLIQVRASLLTLATAQRHAAAPRSLAELIARPGFKLAVVRGFTFGADYDKAIATLRTQRRLIEEPDAGGVARALRAGLAQGSVMAATIFIGTLVSDADLAPLLKQVQVDSLEDMGWAVSGLYLSRHSLSEADRRTLHQAFAQAARTGRLWQLFNDHHPPGSLGASIRSL